MLAKVLLQMTPIVSIGKTMKIEEQDMRSTHTNLKEHLRERTGSGLSDEDKAVLQDLLGE